jgi:hypothetical protein
MNTKKNRGTVVSGVKETYEARVALESLSRAGKNKNLHGIVHEVMYKDALNANPANTLKGAKAALTKSSTAVRDDIVVTQAGKVIGRSQLKDTAKSVHHTVKQVASGKYQRTTLVGTKETVKAYNSEVTKMASKGANITQKMKSSGISSNDTARIASKALGNRLTGSALKSAAKGSGVMGAGVSGAIEILSSGKSLLDGEIDGSEFTSNVAKETVGGGLSAAAGGAAATAVATTAAGLLTASTAPVWVPAALGVGAAVAVGSAVKGIWDSIWD